MNSILDKKVDENLYNKIIYSMDFTVCNAEYSIIKKFTDKNKPSRKNYSGNHNNGKYFQSLQNHQNSFLK